ncbi:hypothetical protein SAMN05421736_106141 [Evansella caseinilytica]|uniref:Uncharacterized protein n=1 Tax=Evansella caseinilytica TaxID=1503961 RepID=A0A1H3QET6_9BACI|nr:hypothetical protein SAMN05421736_106141 [Evansella caseinilytica]
MTTFRRCSQMQPECASRVNLRRVTADAGRGQYLGGIGRIVRNHCLFEQALVRKKSAPSLAKVQPLNQNTDINQKSA